MQLDSILARLDGVRPTKPSTWMARCPAHDDNRASLSIGVGDDGRLLLHCFAGCSAEQIVGAVDLTVGDLFPDEGRDRNSYGVDSRNGHGTRPATVPRPAASKPKAARQEASRRIVATYAYTDESGDLLYEVVRYDPKTFRQRRPDGAGSWAWDIEGVRRVLLGLPAILESVADGSRIWLVEGERDVLNLAKLGVPATTAAQGCGYTGGDPARWRETFTGPLAGADVVIVPDADEPGRAHAERIASVLHGVAASVRVLELPGLAPKGDATDWLRGARERHKGDLAVVRAELDALADAVPVWTPTGGGDASEGNPSRYSAYSPAFVPRIVSPDLSAPDDPDPDWLWQDRILFGGLTAIAGVPKQGKSTVTTDVGARLSSGNRLPRFPDEPWPAPLPPCVVVYANLEDRLKTFKRRLRAAGADMTNLRVARVQTTAAGGWRDLRFPQDSQLIADYVREQGARLLVIDNVSSALFGGADTRNDSEVRGALDPLKQMAEATGCAVVVIVHLNKGRGGDITRRVQGSVAFTGLVRSLLVVTPDPDEPAGPRKLLSVAPGNETDSTATVYFTHEPAAETDENGVTHRVSRLTWSEDETDPRPFNELIARAETALDGDAADDEPKRLAAADWLRNHLADGRRLADDVKAAGQAANYSERTLKRAKSEAGVRSVRVSDGFAGGGRWYWQLAQGGQEEDKGANKIGGPLVDAPSPLCESSADDPDGEEILL